VGKSGAIVLLVSALGCGADIGSGGDQVRPPDGGDDEQDASPGADSATPDGDVPCVGGDAQAEAGGTCFIYVATPATWNAALTGCAGLGGTLAVVDSAEENLLLSTIPPADIELPDIWAAGTDVDTEGTWTWLSGGATFYQGGAVVTWANWRLNEPNNGGENGEGCMIVEGDNLNDDPEGYEWDDRPCGNSYSYMCEL
jgi:hypothetical protein